MWSLKPFLALIVYDSMARLALGKEKQASNMGPGIGVFLADGLKGWHFACLSFLLIRTTKKENPEPGSSIMAIPVA